ncbi:MAG: GNAT family N-acetyltransferase [Bacteroidetes bacterium]|nr:GNAT family N-acetyltransferase [Bacteroidota bacterium]
MKNAQKYKFEFRELKKQDIDIIITKLNDFNINKDKSILNLYLKEQKEGLRNIWVAYNEKELAGYITLKWESEYEPFKDSNIPEINDLFVFQEYRNLGLGNKLITLAEQKAKEKSDYVGLGVGLYADYGSAQRLYIKNGYLPDGRGVTYNYKHIKPNENVKVDDELILWFLKYFN